MPHMDADAQGAIHALLPNYDLTRLTKNSPIANQGQGSNQTQAAPASAGNASAGATAEVYAQDNKTLIGHVVNGKFVSLSQTKVGQ